MPPVGGWRLSALPPTMTAAHVQLLLDKCDHSSDVGVRDFAIMTLVARVGPLSAYSLTCRRRYGQTCRGVERPDEHLAGHGQRARRAFTPATFKTEKRGLACGQLTVTPAVRLQRVGLSAPTCCG